MPAEGHLAHILHLVVSIHPHVRVAHAAVAYSNSSRRPFVVALVVLSHVGACISIVIDVIVEVSLNSRVDLAVYLWIWRI